MFLLLTKFSSLAYKSFHFKVIKLWKSGYTNVKWQRKFNTNMKLVYLILAVCNCIISTIYILRKDGLKWFVFSKPVLIIIITVRKSKFFHLHSNNLKIRWNVSTLTLLQNKISNFLQLNQFYFIFLSSWILQKLMRTSHLMPPDVGNRVTCNIEEGKYTKTNKNALVICCVFILKTLIIS